MKHTVATGMLVFLCCSSTYGHSEYLHTKITEVSADLSFYLNDALRESLGYGYGDFRNRPKLRYVGDASTILDDNGYAPISWLKEGAFWEDMSRYGHPPQLWRALEHFYTLLPRPAGPLNDDSEPSWNIFGLPNNLVDSFSWASQRNVAGIQIPFSIATVGPNTETWQNARDYQLAAVTSFGRSAREENFAHMLFALGHVLHLNQDLSQPDHVRNDNHKNEEHRYIENYGLKYLDQAQRDPLGFHAFSSPWSRDNEVGFFSWLDFGFTRLKDFWDRELYNGQVSALYNDLDPWNAPGQRLGLAEVSNGNFLGEDALYGDYFPPTDRHFFPYPVLSGTDIVALETTLKDGSKGNRVFRTKIREGLDVGVHSVSTFFATLDQKHGITATLSSSINDNLVLENYHETLIPMAIEFSSGILDYFFRCRFRIRANWEHGDTLILSLDEYGSGQSLSGGTFDLYYDDSQGNRRKISPFTECECGEAGRDYPGRRFTFTPPTGEVALYTLVYRDGTAGVSTSGEPLDTVDAGILVLTCLE